MKIPRFIVTMMIVGTGLAGCSSRQNNETEITKTPEAQAMLKTLKSLPAQHKFMFGHHDDPVYGIGWDGDETAVT
mgnify:FL=1